MSDILNPETIAWQGRAWVPKDDFLALKSELKDHTWWERTAKQLQDQRDALAARLAAAEAENERLEAHAEDVEESSRQANKRVAEVEALLRQLASRRVHPQTYIDIDAYLDADHG
jgi:septal ring factor EnvC (AmiA/AmiB activator)